MGAAVRSAWGGGGRRRRQAHEQGLAACGVGGRGPRETAGSPKRDSQGSGPLSGCGQSPPVSPRDGCVGAAASWSAGRYASSFRRACQTVPDGQSAPQTALSRDTPKIRRANSEALLPRRGKQRRSRTPAAYPCPAGQGCVIPLSPQPSLPHWRPVSRTAPPPRATKKGANLSLPERKKILKRSCPLHPLQLQPQRSAPA